jgi:Spy/CpxP family protein refolding chaperone
MNYPIPTSPQEMIALGQQPVSDELVATALAGVIKIARSRQQSLEDLKAEVLADDSVLNREQRVWLSELVTQAWQCLP